MTQVTTDATKALELEAGQYVELCYKPKYGHPATRDVVVAKVESVDSETASDGVEHGEVRLSDTELEDAEPVLYKWNAVNGDLRLKVVGETTIKLYERSDVRGQDWERVSDEKIHHAADDLDIPVELEVTDNPLSEPEGGDLFGAE